MINAEDQVVKFYAEKRDMVKEAVSNLALKVYGNKIKYGKKSIVLTGCTPSNGTTMIAINLAVALTEPGHKTLLIDADMRTRIKHGNRAADNGLCEVISGQCSEADAIRLTNFPDLHFMPAGNRAKNPVLSLCNNEAADLISRVSDKYDFVIIDCPAVTVVPDASALFINVDGILLVCTLDVTTKKQLRSAKSLIEPYAEKYYGLIVNSVDSREYRRLFPNYDYYLEKPKSNHKSNRWGKKVKKAR